jgi:hypothetical protein
MVLYSFVPIKLRLRLRTTESISDPLQSLIESEPETTSRSQLVWHENVDVAGLDLEQHLLRAAMQ